MNMEAIQHLNTQSPTDLLTKSDTDLEAFFADAGLEVKVVIHCSDATCPTCFASNPAKAA